MIGLAEAKHWPCCCGRAESGNTNTQFSSLYAHRREWKPSEGGLAYRNGCQNFLGGFAKGTRTPFCLEGGFSRHERVLPRSPVLRVLYQSVQCCVDEKKEKSRAEHDHIKILMVLLPPF